MSEIYGRDRIYTIHGGGEGKKGEVGGCRGRREETREGEGVGKTGRGKAGFIECRHTLWILEEGRGEGERM